MANKHLQFRCKDKKNNSEMFTILVNFNPRNTNRTKHRPLLVAKITIGAIGLSKALCK